VFDKINAYYKVGSSAFCPANTQNTVWRDRRDFPLLYVPSYVSFRFCDILKMYVAQAVLRRARRTLAYQGATVFQDRNPHDSFADFLEECQMYVNVDRLLALLDEATETVDLAPRAMRSLYTRLVDAGIVGDARELPLLQAWLEAIGSG
jgi:hypothetical protein